MAIKAEDVRKVSFDQAKRGYDTEQVDAFLEEVEQALEIYESRSGSVSSGAPASRSSSASRERDLARRQDDIAKALIVAQQAASQVLDEANEKATNIVAEARSRAEKMLTDAREKAENLRMKAEAEQYAIVE
ncbi:MAG: DivIVA domain-containing protein, partial [Christensenellaceae bacterium]